MKKYLPLLYMSGAILVVLGLCAYLPWRQGAPYVLIVGAVMMTAAMMLEPKTSRNPVIRRLYRQRDFSGVLLILTGVLMIFLPRGNEWILALAAAAVIQGYATFRIPILEKREENRK